jgi:RND family efflux transporter MFP subunit
VRKEKIKRFLMPVGVLLIGVVGWQIMFATMPEPEKANEEPRPMTLFVEDVSMMNLELKVNTQGEVRSKTEIQIVPQVSGRIVSVSRAFTQGGSFEAGETLIKIDDSDYLIAVIRAEAQVAAAQLQLMQMEGSAEVARRQWDSTVGGAASSLALKEPQVANARAMLRSAEADLEGANLNLDRTNISVPFSGRVRDKLADLGQYVTPGTPLGRVFSTEIAEIRLPLTDRQLETLGLPLAYEAKAGEEPTVTLSTVVGNQMHTWHGSLVRTNASVDSSTRMVFAIVEVLLPYGDEYSEKMPLAVGLFVNAEIDGRNVQEAHVIPREALRSGNRVYVVNSQGELNIREVTVVYSDVDKAIVSSGVVVGEQVVISSIRNPTEGVKVQALKRTSSPNLLTVAD